MYWLGIVSLNINTKMSESIKKDNSINNEQEADEMINNKRKLPVSIIDEQGPLTKDGEMPQKKFYRARAHW